MARPTQTELALREAIENWRAANEDMDIKIGLLMKMLMEYGSKGLIPNGVALAVEEMKRTIYKQSGLVDARSRDALARLDEWWIQQQDRKNSGKFGNFADIAIEMQQRERERERERQ